MAKPFLFLLFLVASAAQAEQVLVDCVKFWNDRCVFNEESKVYQCSSGSVSSWRRGNTEAYKITVRQRSNGTVYVEKSAHEPGITTKHLLLFDTSPTIMNCITYQQQWDCESSNRHLAVKALRSVNSYGVGMAMTTRIGGDVLMLGGFDSSQLCLVDGKELP